MSDFKKSAAQWNACAPADQQKYAPEEVFEAGLRNHHIANTAYPIAHRTTFKPYRVPRARMREVALAGLNTFEEMCLYVHIPFCETRCSFCEYTVVSKDDLKETDLYVNALLKEFELYDDALDLSQRKFGGMDIGGGTPSFLPSQDIERIMNAITKRCSFTDDSDISIETTPKIASADPQKIRAYKAMGIDRISMGIQVIQPDLLRVLNRSENGVDHHFKATEAIRSAGFDRFNVDLMYGFKDQSLESWRATLEHTFALAPEYITLYRMRYKLTRISHQADAVTLDDVRPLQALAKEMLSAAGYKANPGKTTYSKVAGDVGTSRYLQRRVQEGIPYLGLGLGAQTFTHTTIAYNDGAVGKNLKPYLKSVNQNRLPIQDLYDLPKRQMMAKMCAVSFYFGEILRAPFKEKFGEALTHVFKDEIAFLLNEGIMTLNERALSLTSKGVRYKNGVIPLFAAPSIQRYLIDRNDSADLKKNRKAALKVVGT